MYQRLINFLQSLVQNISFSFPDISNSSTKKFFPVLIFAYLINRLFTFLGRFIDSEDMLGFYINFVEGIINCITFCYLTNFTWSFLSWVYIIWSLGTFWCYIIVSLAPLFMSDSELNDGAGFFDNEDKDWLLNAKNNSKDNNKQFFYF